VVCALTALWATAALAQTAALPSAQLQGHIRAIQGDTLDGYNARGRAGIGIVGIKAPSGNTVCGREATAFAQELISEGVELWEEPGLVLDRRNRRMYHVILPDGRSLAEVLVAAGLARADGQATNRDRLVELETAARKARRGCLWGAGG
jgi:endonuclease YncB( thermonuclease family)